MKLHKLICPNCSGKLDIKIDKMNSIFCPYCGEKFVTENEKKEYEYTINKNININKTYRKIDEADVIRAKTEDKAGKYALWILLGCVIVYALLMVYINYMMGAEDRAAQKALKEGRISAGSNRDYEGENYKAVVEQLKALGFKNITTIDLEDSGLVFWSNDNVESVSIAGDTSFDSTDYYNPDESIIVTYH